MRARPEAEQVRSESTAYLRMDNFISRIRKRRSPSLETLSNKYPPHPDHRSRPAFERISAGAELSTPPPKQ